MAGKAEELESRAERKLKGWAFFGSKNEDAVELFEKAANCYKIQKLWDKAGDCFIKQANCLLKCNSRYEAATAYVEAGKAYMKNKPQDAAGCFDEAAKLFLEAGRLTSAAKNYKDIAEIYEKEEKVEEAVEYFSKAADIYAGEEQKSSADQCNLKVAQHSAELEHYPKAIEIYEEIARRSLDNNLLKYNVKNHLLCAGLCHLCRDDVVAIQNALDKYQDLDPTFSNTREYRLLTELAEAVEEVDVTKFTDAVKEFDSMTRLDTWKTTLLLRAKKTLKAKEDEDSDDLT